MPYNLSSAMIVTAPIFWRGGISYDVDFHRGIVIQVRLEKKQNLADIKEALRNRQIEGTLIQAFSEENES